MNAEPDAEFADGDCVVISVGEPSRVASLGALLPRTFDAAFLRQQSG